MVVKQSNAHNKHCVYWAFIPKDESYNNGCKGSDCMAWRFIFESTEDDQGFCGLAESITD